MRKTVLAVLLVAPVAPAPASPLSYDYVDLAYAAIRPDDARLDADGISAEWVRTRSPQTFFTVGVSRTVTGHVTLPDVIPATPFAGRLITTTLSGGAGAHRSVTDKTDLVFGASLVFTKIQADGQNGEYFDDEDVGPSVGVGLRSLLTERIECRVGAGYSFIGDGTASLDAGARASVTSRVALAIQAEIGSDASAYTAGIRIEF